MQLICKCGSTSFSVTVGQAMNQYECQQCGNVKWIDQLEECIAHKLAQMEREKSNG